MQDDIPPAPDDSALANAARAGDIGAYETLVRRYQNLALRTAYVVVGDASEAEDAVQDAFIKAYHALPRFRPDAPFRPWLLRIVANEARNRRKARARRDGLALRAAETRPAGQAPLAPDEAALLAEQRAALLRALNGLTVADRLAVAYRYFFDLSEAEMAEALGVARGTVKSRLSRALGRLRETVVRERDGEDRRRDDRTSGAAGSAGSAGSADGRPGDG